MKLISIAAVVVAALLSMLSACALTVSSANPRQVIIEREHAFQSNADAQRLADAECAKYKRHAKMDAWPVQGVSRTWAFSCVE